MSEGDEEEESGQVGKQDECKEREEEGWREGRKGGKEEWEGIHKVRGPIRRYTLCFRWLGRRLSDWLTGTACCDSS